MTDSLVLAVYLQFTNKKDYIEIYVGFNAAFDNTTGYAAFKTWGLSVYNSDEEADEADGEACQID
jgi:hypothetical protein